MQDGDISGWEFARIGLIFEGLLGVKPPPAKGLIAKLKRKGAGIEEAEAEAWEFDDIVFRSLRALEVKGYQVALEIYTFLGHEFAEQLDHKLGRWGVSANAVIAFTDQFELARYLRAHLDITTVYTSNQDWAAVIGPRAQVRLANIPLGF